METDSAPRVLIRQGDEIDIAMDEDPAEVRRVRRAVVAAVRSDDIEPTRLQEALIAISELVSNALVHGGPPRRVRLSLASQGLLVEVFDGSLRRPHLVHTAASEPGGHGLQLVAQLATDWGTTPCTDGKWVWCLIGFTR